MEITPVAFRNDTHREVAIALTRDAYHVIAARIREAVYNRQGVVIDGLTYGITVSMVDMWWHCRGDLPEIGEVYSAAVAIAEEWNGERTEIGIDHEGEGLFRIEAP